MKTVFDEIVKNKLRMYELELKTLERLDSKLKDFFRYSWNYSTAW